MGTDRTNYDSSICPSLNYAPVPNTIRRGRASSSPRAMTGMAAAAAKSLSPSDSSLVSDGGSTRAVSGSSTWIRITYRRSRPAPLLPATKAWCGPIGPDGSNPTGNDSVRKPRSISTRTPLCK